MRCVEDLLYLNLNVFDPSTEFMSLLVPRIRSIQVNSGLAKGLSSLPATETRNQLPTSRASVVCPIITSSYAGFHFVAYRRTKRGQEYLVEPGCCDQQPTSDRHLS